MIAEEQQDRAALYVLGRLDAEAIAAFERALEKDPHLRELVHEFREAAATLALAAPQTEPPATLKARLLHEIAGRAPESLQKGQPFAVSRWLPWAIAAALLIFCSLLLEDRQHLRRQLAEARNVDPLMRTKFVELNPANGAPANVRAMVAWEPDKQIGFIRIVGLPAAGSGKDYQLWAVDAEHKDPVSAGIVHVDQNGVAQMRFKPEVATRRVKAFALTLEREGGVPKAEGPILLLGNT